MNIYVQIIKAVLGRMLHLHNKIKRGVNYEKCMKIKIKIKSEFKRKTKTKANKKASKEKELKKMLLHDCKHVF